MPARKSPAAPPARSASPWMRAARPDAIDFRDRWFVPRVSAAPPATLFPAQALGVKHQGRTNACTGFALALVVEHLLRLAEREADPAISGYMLYSMARRYDEFPGSAADEGSSLRGALKGWFRHGACHEGLFPGLQMPPAAVRIEDDWWFDAVRRPLGAYYRIAPSQLTDMHAALDEVGVLYVSSGCHAGWDEGLRTRAVARPKDFRGVWEIPVRGGDAEHAGHAFAIVGYNERGFLIQNSWGPAWGSHGLALMTYPDWLANAIDCWVAQLGVVTQDHRELARADTLRTRAGRVQLAASPVLRQREIAPFVVNVGRGGALANAGVFRTRPDDVRALAELQLARARQAWQPADGVIDVCVVVHGGLGDEAEAAASAEHWITALYQARVFPVFLMWDSGLQRGLRELLAPLQAGAAALAPGGRQPGGASVGDAALDRAWNARVERALAPQGSALWAAVRREADALSLFRPRSGDDRQAGAVLLYRHFKHQVQDRAVRMHLMAHSAGALAACRLVQRLVGDGVLSFDSLSLLAPAVRNAEFAQTLAPLLHDGRVRRLQLFALSAQAEAADASLPPYRRSLLHLVSQAFEGGTRQPVLGLQADAQAGLQGLPRTRLHLSPGAHAQATTHAAFDRDAAVLKQVLRFIRARR